MFWIAIPYRKIGRKNTFDFGGLYMGAKKVFEDVFSFFFNILLS
jgi:hypothetical protein